MIKGGLSMQNSISCSVDSCKYNESSKNCTLNDVSVGATTFSEPEAKKDTQCGSFECSSSR